MSLFHFDDGGRTAAGFRGMTGDCVTRAIAVASQRPYLQVYNELQACIHDYAASHRDRVAKHIARGGGRRGTTPRNGIAKQVYHPYLANHGWQWTPTMAIGIGCTVHLVADELPKGRLIVRVSKHLVAVIDGVIHDTHDSSRAGTRCVYGFYQQPSS